MWELDLDSPLAQGAAGALAMLLAVLPAGAAAGAPATAATAAATATAATPAVSESAAGSLHGVLAPNDPSRRPAAGPGAPGKGTVYDRPFVASAGGGGNRTAIGGYLEANSNYFVEDGIPEGFGFEFRRFNLFTYASVGSAVKAFAELEFEHGTEEIALETAQLDFLIDRRFSLKAGILLPAIGRFNVNHDAPRYAFVERPMVSERILPATLSEVGAGAYGAVRFGARKLSYELNVVNGLGAGVVLNDGGRTSLPAGKSEAAFAGDNNGVPSVNARVAIAHEPFGEIGLSHYGGPYNSFRLDGETVAPRRWLHAGALDWDMLLWGLTVQGEAAVVVVDVAPDLEELFAQRQWGIYTDLIYPIVRFDWLAGARSVLNAAVRIDRIDFHAGEFTTGPAAGGKVFDEETALSLGLAFRPVPDTVVRLNYRHHWIRDLLGNPAVRRAGVQVGVASYF